jgi:hypothetical protein
MIRTKRAGAQSFQMDRLTLSLFGEQPRLTCFP